MLPEFYEHQAQPCIEGLFNIVVDNTVVVMIKCFTPLNVGHVQNRFCNVLYCVANHFLCCCVYDCICIDHESATNYYYCLMKYAECLKIDLVKHVISLRLEQ